jgi:hypothetical protein
MYDVDQILQKKLKTDMYTNNQFINPIESQYQTTPDLYQASQLGLNAYRMQEALRSTQPYAQQNQSMEGLISQNLNPQFLQRNLMMSSRQNSYNQEQAALQAQMNFGFENPSISNARKAMNDYNLFQAVQQQQAYGMTPSFQNQASYQMNPQNSYVQQGFYQEPQNLGLISNQMVMTQPQSGSFMLMNGNQIVQIPGGNFAILNVDNNSNYNQMVPQQQMVFNNGQYNNYQAAKQTEVNIPNFDYQAFERSQTYEQSNSTKGSEDEKSEGDSRGCTPKELSENMLAGQQNAEKKKRRPRTYLNIEVNSSPENQALKSKERRRNRWQEEKEELEKVKVFDRVKYINETEFGLHDDQKKADCPIGPAHQAVVPVFAPSETKRAPTLKWSPEICEDSKMSFLNESIKEKLAIECNDEKLIKLLAENDHNTENVLNLIEADKKKYSKYFQVKLFKPKNEAI